MTVPTTPPRGRPHLMGVLNVTPDSFSDGGRWLDTRAAVEHGLALVRDGADLVDVGGESTRPGATRPSAEEELDRVVPVIRALVAQGVTVSVDTMRAQVAAAAVEAGAAIVNDVSGGLADPRLAEVVAGTGATMVVQHWRAHGATMQSRDHLDYDDVVTDVVRELRQRVRELQAAGVREEQLVLDPGIGFSKHAEHNWTLLGRLPELHALGRPLLLGTSRKAFLGSLLAAPGADGSLVPRPPAERDTATAATSLLAAQAGVWGLRVHDVRASADALAVLHAWTARMPSAPSPEATEASA
ncbi:dihydropteroate synthase [Arsenicicoccus sp. oral taxon 190]|uniref:dihydropteroate synthase n=1 Tax=Arsenicicoccus sp. oral taxon 190 TaxID=1658671 RepID=UPI00067A25EC|nr:dihydropteroate synthase [Arsenicicoccus sp. oral taxon 190]AKT51172.1 dihydropteroate synthase [Arsenicicoccus sp. oral taxon 190]